MILKKDDTNFRLFFFFFNKFFRFDDSTILVLCPYFRFLPFFFVTHSINWRAQVDKNTHSVTIFIDNEQMKIDNLATYFSIRKGFTTICWMAQPVLTNVIYSISFLSVLIENSALSHWRNVCCLREKTLTKNEKNEQEFSCVLSVVFQL